MRHSVSRFALAPLFVSLAVGCSRAPSAAPPAAQSVSQAVTSPTSQAPSLAHVETGSLVRKVIRTAQLRVEADDPAAVQRRASEIVEQLGGFVVGTESRRTESSTDSIDVELVMRVPSDQFATALERLRQTATRVIDEKIGGQDVTEEYIDLEAELRAKRALETQFLEIMKTARAVKDALEVEERLGVVRGEIEKLEGRRRFLENQSALSTITMNVDRTKTLVVASSSGFGRTFREAGADLVNVSTAIVTGGVRVTAWVVPLLALVAFPLYVAARLLRRLLRRTPVAAQHGSWLT